MVKLSLLWTTLSLVAASTLLPAAAWSRGSPSSITPHLVTSMIESYGSKQTVALLINQRTNDKNDHLGSFELVLNGIMSGDSAWLALVPALYAGADAAAGESLPISVAYALPKNPAGVLRLIAQDGKWLVACGYPMIEPTRKEDRAYFKAAIPAVRAIGDPPLQLVKHMCLSELLKAQRTP